MIFEVFTAVGIDIFIIWFISPFRISLRPSPLLRREKAVSSEATLAIYRVRDDITQKTKILIFPSVRNSNSTNLRGEIIRIGGRRSVGSTALGASALLLAAIY
jgi:hypothetical protein